nr:tRNA(Glu)-specific nuclease WapA [Paraburkholderia busanensis]
MQVIDACVARRRASLRLLAPSLPLARMQRLVFVVVALLSWFVAPSAYANDYCNSRYVAAGVYPADPRCPLKAAAADFGGMGAYICGDPAVIAEYCSGPSGNDTNEPVSPEGSMPDPGDGNCAADATAGCGNSTSGGDPVNLYTGQFYQYSHDLSVADTAGSIELTRVYRSGAYDASGKPLAGAFGIGTVSTYDIVLAKNAATQRLELREATGIRVPFTARAGSGTSWDDLTSPGEYYRARIDSSGSSGMTLTLRDGRVRQFTMVAGAYRLTRLQDRNGNAVVIARDSTTGSVTAITSPNGRALKVSSITGSRGTPLVSRVTDPLKREIAYEYDGQDRLVRVTDAGGGVWRYGWDAQSRLVTLTDPLGNVRVTNTYGNAGDLKDRVVAQTLADDSTFAFSYTVVDGRTTRTDVTDRRGSIRRVEFDGSGHVLRNTYPAGLDVAQVQTFAYDANGRVTNLTSGDREYTYAYDANGNRISEADQFGTLLTRSFDGYSQPLTEAGAGDPQKGVKTVYAYDARGNLLVVTDRLNNRTTRTYDTQGRVLGVTDALNGVTQYRYTGADLTAITDALNRTTQLTTDAAGRVTGVQDPLGHWTRRTLDALDRTTDIADAAGGVTRLTWDRAGNLLSHADPKGVTTRYSYNAAGRPVRKTDPSGHDDTYTWTRAGQIATVTDRKGQVTTYAYDPAGRVVQTGFQPVGGAPFSRSWQFGWDRTNGKLAGVNDNRASERGHMEADGPGTSMLLYYDPVTGRFRSTFDIPGLQGLWNYLYDPVTRERTGIEMDRATVEYSRDAERRITQIAYRVNGEAPRTFGYRYDALGRQTGATLANGIRATYTWDAASQLTGITFRRADGSLLGDLTYGYDLAGRRTTMGGSLAKVNLPQAVSDAQYNAANQLTRWAGRTLSYDLNGKLVSDGVNQYSWNGQGLLAGINAGITGATVASFTYDAFDRRRDQMVNGHRLQSTWLGDELNFMVPDNDWWTRTRVFSTYPEGGLDELTFRRVGDDASQDRYVLRDANNNVIALTDADQQIRTQYSYEPFGETTRIGAADPNTQQYTGRENDGTGLYNYRNRYYSPALARFISEDPIGWASGQTNAYAYVGGNPVQFSDPEGLQWAFPIPAGPMPGMGPQVGGVPPWFNDLVNGITSIKPPTNAYDPNGPKAPGKPSAADGFQDPKGGENWVPNPNPGRGGSAWGWEDSSGDVWCPTGQGGNAHGGPHWDVQSPGGRNRNVRPTRP